MAKRKPLSQKTRFEVFKRDNFKCQYCGRSAPDVILEVDHITPVAEGGDNDILNLITSCKECNRGKGKTRLDDNQTIAKQMAQLEELNERREQLEMLIQWKNGLKDLAEKELEYVQTYFEQNVGKRANEAEIRILKSLLRQFKVTSIIEAMDIALAQYGKRYALPKVGGICYNREHTEKDPNFPYKAQLKRAYTEQFRRKPSQDLIDFFNRQCNSRDEFDELLEIIASSETMEEFVEVLNDYQEERGMGRTWVIRG